MIDNQNLGSMISQYIDGELQGEQLEYVEKQLEENQECQAIYQQLKAVSQGVSGLAAKPPENLTDSIFDKINERKKNAGTFSRYIFTLVAAAAVFVFIVLAQPKKTVIEPLEGQLFPPAPYNVGPDTGIEVAGGKVADGSGFGNANDLELPQLPYDQEFSFYLVTRTAEMHPDFANVEFNQRDGFKDAVIENQWYDALVGYYTQNQIEFTDRGFNPDVAPAGILIILQD